MGSIIPVLVIIIGIVVIIIHGAGIIKYVVVYHDRYNGLSNDLKWSSITIDMGRIILVKYSHTMWSYLTTIATVIIILVTDTQWYITTNHYVRDGGHHICNSILNIRKGCHFLNRGHHYISHGYHHKRHKNNLGTNLGTHPQRACVYFFDSPKITKMVITEKTMSTAFTWSQCKFLAKKCKRSI